MPRPLYIANLISSFVHSFLRFPPLCGNTWHGQTYDWRIGCVATLLGNSSVGPCYNDSIIWIETVLLHQRLWYGNRWWVVLFYSGEFGISGALLFLDLVLLFGWAPSWPVSLLTETGPCVPPVAPSIWSTVLSCLSVCWAFVTESESFSSFLSYTENHSLRFLKLVRISEYRTMLRSPVPVSPLTSPSCVLLAAPSCCCGSFTFTVHLLSHGFTCSVLQAVHNLILSAISLCNYVQPCEI